MNRIRYHLKPLPEDDGIISVTISRVPRWKESELSGDEWRYTNQATIAVKDWTHGGLDTAVTYGRDFADLALKTAAALNELVSYGNQKAAPYSVKELSELRVCFQPGCVNTPTHIYRIIQEWTWHPNQGFRMERASRRGGEEPTVVRAFCPEHSHRGDCDLEDADRNYELLTMDGATAGGCSG